MAIPLSPRAWAPAAAATVAAGILLLAVQAPQARPQPHHAASRDAAAAPAPAPTPATAVSNPCPSSTPIQLANIMPTSFVVGSQQIGADCMAWQEFIALNWPTGTGETFGNPANANPTVWETYQEAEALFN